MYELYISYMCLQPEHPQVVPDPFLECRRRDPLAEPVRGVVAADLRPVLVDRAHVVGRQMRAPLAERLPQRGDVRRDATRATFRALDAHRAWARNSGESMAKGRR